MKRKFALLAVVFILAITTPASASRPVPVGDRINVLTGSPATYPENTPFHIWHGWASDETTRNLSGASFELMVDGAFRAPDYVETTREPGPEGFQVRKWVHNFPEGLTGVHTFTGNWYLPCREAVAGGHIPGPCDNPNTPVLVLTRSLEVTFTP